MIQIFENQQYRQSAPPTTERKININIMIELRKKPKKTWQESMKNLQALELKKTLVKITNQIKNIKK